MFSKTLPGLIYSRLTGSMPIWTQCLALQAWRIVFISCTLLFLLTCSSVSASTFEIYFGDLHGHSSLSSDGCGDPEDYFPNAINNQLDFAAITDHAEGMDKDTWSYVRRLAESYNQSGFFVSFIGYEWSHHTYGHKTVLFKNDDIPDKPLLKTSPNTLWAALSDYQVLTLPHHPAGGPAPTDWREHDPDFQPLVEMISKHGNSEYSINNVSWELNEEDIYEPTPYYHENDGLDHSVNHAIYERGYRIGLIGGTDNHSADPGNIDKYESCLRSTVHLYKGGLTAVLARRLSRHSLWEAMNSRRTYVTSGPKIMLRFSINGEPMGSEITARRSPRIKVSATAPEGKTIEKVIVQKDGKRFWIVPVDANSVHFSEADDNYSQDTIYAVKVILTNGERAWSSPIWVDKR